MMLYLKQRKEEVEDSENALRELERLMKNINIMKTEYEQMHKERVRARLGGAKVGFQYTSLDA